MRICWSIKCQSRWNDWLGLLGRASEYDIPSSARLFVMCDRTLRYLAGSTGYPATASIAAGCFDAGFKAPGGNCLLPIGKHLSDSSREPRGLVRLSCVLCLFFEFGEQVSVLGTAVSSGTYRTTGEGCSVVFIVARGRRVISLLHFLLLTVVVEFQWVRLIHKALEPRAILADVGQAILIPFAQPPAEVLRIGPGLLRLGMADRALELDCIHDNQPAISACHQSPMVYPLRP